MLRMVWIRNRYRERVIEDSLTLVKADAMFCLIASGLVFVPFEYEIHQCLFQCRMTEVTLPPSGWHSTFREGKLWVTAEKTGVFASPVHGLVQVSRYRGRSDIYLSPDFSFNSLHLYPFQQAATMPLQINILHAGRKERHHGSTTNTLVQQNCRGTSV